jgi:hypothetical protein
VIETTQEGDHLRRLFPPGRSVDPTALERLRAPHPVLTADFRAGLIDHNPLGETSAAEDLDERMVPVEEGETSLNANANQALASLLPRVLGAKQGLRPTVIGTLAGGNHGLDHSLARLARSFPDPAAVRRRLVEAFGPAALAAATALLASHHRSVRKSFERLPETLRRARALRLPPCAIAVPGPGRLADLGAALDLDPPLRDLLAQAGSATVADFFVLLRACLLQRLGHLLGARGIYVPATLEVLLTRGTGAFARRTLPELAISTASQAPALRRSTKGRFRALHVWDPVQLLTSGRRPAGGTIEGWSWIWADHATGALYPGPGERELLDLPLAGLLARGYGLSGRLLYPAVRQVNGGAVCNQVFSTPRPGVFAGLAEPGNPALVLPLTWTNVNGAWQTGAELRRCPPVDLLVLTQWVERSPDPAKAIGRVFAAFVEGCRAPGRGGVVLGEKPGEVAVYA